MRIALFAGLVVLAPTVAHATVGGPTVVEVVGYAPIDRKIYWLERHEGEGDGLPQLWFVRVDGPHAGRPIAVKSWYEGVPGSAEERAGFESRLVRLRRHVVAMRETTSRWTLTTDVVATTTWTGEPLGFGPRPQHEVRCELVDTTARSTARATTVTVFEAPTVTLAQAFTIPDGDAGLVVLRYLGDPFESGYTVDTAVVTR